MMLAARRLLGLGAFILSTACITFVGCVGDRSGSEPEVARPEDIRSFSTLYKTNCSACHGENGKNAAAISLSNPVYLAVAGEDHLRDVIAKGVPNALMPPFARSAGGMLTDQQVTILAQGMIHAWGKPNLLATQNAPPYSSTLPGDVARGQQAFATFCARCHGPTGEGNMADAKRTSGKIGSIVDPSYLALISDQYLRSNIIAGRPDQGMPDWRSDAAQPMTDQQITDIVTWLASKRTADPGQPYRSHQ
ncbi:MAG TPA: c-type cytochrome [Edaphobacter sp.]|nr:c-type cytochrome [Edaphobacter sp.]